MGYLAPGENFENIPNRKWLLSYRNNDISCRDARGFRGMLPEKILKLLFIIKNIDYSYTSGYTLAMGYFVPREI